MKYNTTLIVTALALWTTEVDAKEAQNPKASSQRLSFTSIREALRQSPTQKELQDRLKALSEKSYEARVSRDGIVASELEGTRGVGDNKENRYGISVMKNFVLGRSLDTWRGSYDAEAKAKQMQAMNELNEQLMQLGDTYTSLLFIQRQGNAAAKALEVLKPMVAMAERGQTTGSAAGLAVLKWRLLEKRISAQHQNANSSFRALVHSMNAILRTKFDEKMDTAVLVNLTHPHEHKEIDFKELSAVAALRKRQESLGLKAKALESRTEFSAGVGMERDESDKLNSVLLRISIPIGQGSALTSEAHEARAEMNTVQSEELRLIESLQRRERMLHGYMESKAASVASLMTLRNDIEKILDTVSKGLGRGLAEFTEVVEAVENLYETEIALAEAQRELDDVLIEIAVLTEDKL